MFDKLISEIENDEKQKENQEMVNIDIDNCVNSPEALIEKLKGIEAMSDKDAYALVLAKYPEILSGDSRFNFVKKNYRFITTLTQVTYERNFTDEEVIHCNAFIYDYIINENEPDKYLVKLLLILGEAINKVYVNKLLGQELDQELAIFLAVANQSTANSTVNIKRFNYTLATAKNNTPEFFTIQRLINIYSTMYNTNFSKLLVAVLFDTIIKNAAENGEIWVTKDMIEINENMSWAVIFILESLPPQDITRYLYIISETFSVSYRADRESAKMSLHGLPSNLFVKIPIIVEQLEGLEETVTIP